LRSKWPGVWAERHDRRQRQEELVAA
jgi:hypothetical protein